ncbi:unnamed protein product [Mytilus coruscus]|uniref:Reverse transcriptase domain-containing protein n=1 Tax=Mytilus coruscus TaxID=42192 RepID=A0A6J8CJU4_MYTCO|nr:unnamed protein product [Mytilus coruscus]
MYLDDGFGTHSDINACTDIATQVKQDLIESGFVPKVEKSMWSPSKTLKYLCYFIDTDKAILSVPVERLSKLFDTIIQVEPSFENLGKVYVRTVASVIGQIISMSYVIGNVAYIMTKYLSIDVMSVCSWNLILNFRFKVKSSLYSGGKILNVLISNILYPIFRVTLLFIVMLVALDMVDMQ